MKPWYHRLKWYLIDWWIYSWQPSAGTHVYVIRLNLFRNWYFGAFPGQTITTAGLPCRRTLRPDNDIKPFMAGGVHMNQYTGSEFVQVMVCPLFSAKEIRAIYEKVKFECRREMLAILFKPHSICQTQGKIHQSIRWPNPRKHTLLWQNWNRSSATSMWPLPTKLWYVNSLRPSDAYMRQ